METYSRILTDECNKIKIERKWKSTSRIVGEAVENCVVNMPCPVCGNKALVKYKQNEKSKDVRCEHCGCKIQIKSKKNTKKQHTTLTLLGAEYRTTCSAIIENEINYLVLLYSVSKDKYTINNIFFIDCVDINESCIIPRKPLSSKAKRAGWQGCTLVFNKFKPINLPN